MGWTLLRDELDAWAEAGRSATLWWRDDDAVTWTPALYRLVQMGRAASVPLALAVIPAEADSRLSARLLREPHVRVLQHGYTHRNHAGSGEKKSEYASLRTLPEMTVDLCLGWLRLAELFGGQALPVLVPPWNRMAAAGVAALAGLGYRGLSMFGPRRRDHEDIGLAWINTHVDIVDWRGGRGFVGEQRALDALVGHLRMRRLGQVDAAEPTGVLTHHLDHDDGCWTFLERLVAATGRHPAAQWLPAEALFPGNGEVDPRLAITSDRSA